ncbi:hypothetical protein MUCCIDRAFT_114834 [Mucor lusitanicus CBS 277.49]|uniref:Uncharacterized protein n=2 Tax=Mucor circinelloides f. lusitanicus TaxID=29924 RepID=A0A168I7D2_MUCCL|nr:hypothetical protein MUCCIDRAFT_114834 [Mucor lusitanicus CBS 277.49]
MPVIHDSSPPITAEDMMPTSAFEVSPILTSSIFDEIYTSIVAEIDDDDDDDEEDQDIPPATTMRQSFLPPPVQQQARRRHTPLGRLNARNGNNGIFELPPPSARWTRRLSTMQRINNEQDVGQQPGEVDHIGPVMPTNTSFPRSDATSFLYGQQCLSDRAYNTSPLLQQGQSTRVNMLDFEVVYDDGGQYGAMYGIENLLLNDGSVYWQGTVNILAQYCGYIESGLVADKTCSISKMVIKAPQHGFTAPCRDGMIFISHKQINTADTSQFDKFTKHDYDQYIANKLHKNSMLEDADPVAWFSLTNDRTTVVDLGFRSAKYVLIKMLRADYESDNIDMQYIGFIGHSGPRSFGSGKLC